jgi:hypothetical protein
LPKRLDLCDRHPMKTGVAFFSVIGALAALTACSAPKVPEVLSPGDAEAPPASSSSAAPAPSASAPTSSTPEPTVAPPKAGAITMEEDEGCTKVAAAFEQKARPKIKECYREGKKLNPVLEGGIRIVINVDAFGKLGAVKTQDVTLPDAVAKCMVKAVQATPFDDATQCKRKGITLPIQFPTK